MTSLWKPSIVPWRNHSTERLGLKNGWTCTLKCKPPSSQWWTTNQDFTRHFNGHLQHLAWPRLSTSASLNTTKTGVWVWNTVARRCWTRSKALHGKKNENGSFASDLRSVHIARYAIEIVWYGHYRPSSTFKGHNTGRSCSIFFRKGCRNRCLLLDS